MSLYNVPFLDLVLARCCFLSVYVASPCGGLSLFSKYPFLCHYLFHLGQALEKISSESPSSVVREGGLVAVLTYLDFFPSAVQRTAMNAAANMCREYVLFLLVLPIRRMSRGHLYNIECSFSLFQHPRGLF